MNYLKSIVVISISFFLFTSCKQTNSEATENAIPVAKLETASFNIEGMTCAIGCAKTIEKQLSETEGVQKASVDFDNKLAKVSFDASKLTPESLVKIVEATADGKTYKVSNVKASGNKAMLLEQEPEKEKKEDQKKSCDSDSKKTKKAKGCCAKKKHCEKDDKKASTM